MADQELIDHLALNAPEGTTGTLYGVTDQGPNVMEASVGPLADAINVNVGSFFQLVSQTLTSITLSNGSVEYNGVKYHNEGGVLSTVSTPALVLSNTNYIEVQNDGTFSINQSAFETDGSKLKVCRVVMNGSQITSVTDDRTGFVFSNTAAAIDIHGMASEVTGSDSDELVEWNQVAGANKKVTKGNLFARFLAAARTHTANLFINGGVFGVGGTSNDASALVQFNSTTKGFLPMRLTTVQRDAISSPLEPLTVYNSDTGQYEYWNGAAWVAVGPVGGGEANTASNVGSGEGLAVAKVGVDLPFKSLTEGVGITLTGSADEIEIAFSGAVGEQDYLDLVRQASNPAAPGAGNGRLFLATPGNNPFWRDSSGTVHIVVIAGPVVDSLLTQATGKLLGRSTASDGPVEEITLDASLDLTGGVLSVVGSGITPPAAITLTPVSDIYSFDGNDSDLFNINRGADCTLDYDKTLALFDGQVVQFRVAVSGDFNLQFSGDVQPSLEVQAMMAGSDLPLTPGEYSIFSQYDDRGTGQWWVNQAVKLID